MKKISRDLPAIRAGAKSRGRPSRASGDRVDVGALGDASRGGSGSPGDAGESHGTAAAAIAPATIAARKPRGRPRSFDRAAALERAIEVFWAKGYEAASISDLCAAMGINPPSLYSAFGDKDRLFLEAVSRYEEQQGDSCPYSAESTARGAFEKLLTFMADTLTSADHPRGCMLMMAAATANSASPELQEALARRRAESRAGMQWRIEKGIADGDVPAGTDASALSDFYVTIINGMSMQARDGATRASLLGTVQRAMTLFPAVAGTTGPSAKRASKSRRG